MIDITINLLSDTLCWLKISHCIVLSTNIFVINTPFFFSIVIFILKVKRTFFNYYNSWSNKFFKCVHRKRAYGNNSVFKSMVTVLSKVLISILSLYRCFFLSPSSTQLLKSWYPTNAKTFGFSWLKQKLNLLNKTFVGCLFTTVCTVWNLFY